MRKIKLTLSASKMFFRNKRGMEREALWWFIDILILCLVLYLIFRYVDEAGSQTTFQKRFLAKDTALLMDTLYSTPGNIYINYPQNTLWFGFEFAKNKVTVFESQRDPPNLKENEYFFEDEGMDINYRTISPAETYKPKETLIQKYIPVLEVYKRNRFELNKTQTLNLTFIKTNKEISILNDEPIPKISYLDCPTYKSINNLVFVIDDSNNDFYEKYSSFLENYGKIEDKNYLEQDNNKGAILFFIKFNQDREYDYIKSYFDADTSFERLSPISCNLVNNFLSISMADDIYSTSIPSNKATLNAKLGMGDYSNILILEIAKKGPFTDDDFQKLTKSIHMTLSGKSD